MSRAVNVHLPDALYDAAEVYAQDNGIGVPDLIRMTLVRALAKDGYYKGPGRGGARKGAGRKKHDTATKESNTAVALKTMAYQTETAQPTETHREGEEVSGG